MIKRAVIIFFFVLNIAFLKPVCFAEVPGSPFPAGTSTFAIAFSPELSSGNLIAATANNLGTTSAYLVDKTTGLFTPVSGSPFMTIFGSTWIDFTKESTGNLFAAISNESGSSISVFLVNPTTGVFTPVAGSPFAALSSPRCVAFSPNIGGSIFAAAACNNTNLIRIYSVNTTTGVFTQVSTFAVTTPTFVAYSQNLSGLLFAAFISGNNIHVCSVNTTTGVFTPVAGSPFPAGQNPNCVVFSPLVGGNLFAAASNLTSDNISVYSVNTTTGVFTQVPGSPFASNTLPRPGAFVLDNQNNLYAAFPSVFDQTVNVYSVNTTTGFFTQVPGSPFVTTVPQQGLAFTPLLNTNYAFAAIANSGDQVVHTYQFIIPVPVLSTANASCTGVTVSGSGAIANAKISVYADGVQSLGTGTADGSGNFNFSINAFLSFGPHTITITQSTAQGCESVQSNGIVVNSVQASAPTLSSAIFNCAKINISGSGADANAIITVFADTSQNLGTRTADAAGNFGLSLNANLTNGTHAITVKQTNSFSCTSLASNAINVDVSCNVLRITSPANNTVTTNNSQTIAGIAPEGEKITVFANRQTLNNAESRSTMQLVLGTTTADSFGNWSLIPVIPLIPAIYVIFATLTDHPAVQSNRITLTIEPSTRFDVLSERILNKYGCRL